MGCFGASTMPVLTESFEAVADWCERHLETTRGREVGMTFGAAVRAYGRLATKPAHLLGEKEVVERRLLNENAEKLLLDFSRRFWVAYGWYEDKSKRILQPTNQSTNMTYDPGTQH
jgi:hypothetical protein